MVHWAVGLEISPDKLKPLYLHYQNAYDHQTWEGGWPNRRICAFHFVEIRCAFCLYLQKGLEFFVIKFYSSSPSFKRNILRSLNLEFKTSAHAQIAITHYSYYLQISWHDINLKLTLEIHFDKWSWLMNFNNLIRWPFLEMCSGM